jgi:type IV secretion system protein VirD4
MRWALAVGIVVLASSVESATAAAAPVSTIAVCVAMVVLLVVCLWPRRPLRVPAAPAGARWADREDAVPLAAPGAFLLGLWGRARTPLYLTEERLSGHVLVVGPSRTGKTAGVIAPNLLYRDPTRESAVVLDIKTGPRSLWNITAGRYGTRAHLFCPFFEGSVGYNPLARVDSIGAAQRKAALLVQNTTARDLSGDAHVYAAATTDLAALLFMHVQQDRSRGGHTVGAVYRLALGGPAFIRETLRSSAVADVRERHGIFAARERRVQEAAVTGLIERLAPWIDPLVARATSQHFDLAALGREPAALYILMPETDAAQLQSLVAWLVADLLDELIDRAEREGPRVPVRMFLDEFRQFGYLSGFSEALPTLRERGISVLLGVQTLSQIEEVYGRAEARTLLGNTETKLLFRAGDLETARMISGWLGRTTVPAVSVTTRGRDRSTTVHPFILPLMPPEELTRIPDGAMIALAGAARPLLLWQARYFSLPGLVASPPPFALRRLSPPTLAVAPSNPAPPSLPRGTPPRPAGGVQGRRKTGGEAPGA